MKHSSMQYPILDNKPIDQWKVTELREELRRRRLPAKGLKEELVRRLDGALRDEIETVEDKEEELGNGFDPNSDPDVDPNNDPDGKVTEKNSEPVDGNNSEPVEDKREKVDIDAALVDINDAPLDVNQGIQDEDQNEKTSNNSDAIQDEDQNEKTTNKSDAIQHEDQNEKTSNNSDAIVEDTTVTVPHVEKTVSDSQNVATELGPSEQDTGHDEKNDDSKPAAQDVTPNVTEPNDQVSEVSQDLGFQVKCESISTDSVSINEKNELKDNLNANNVHLELEVVKPEMVQPSSSDIPTTGGDSHPLEEEKKLLDNRGSQEEADDAICAMDVEIVKKNDITDGGSPEKLNLDRSSGDESMEEDVVESKQIESRNISEVGGRGDEGISKADVEQIRNAIDAVVAGSSPEKKDMVAEEDPKPTAPVEKRKAEESVVAINEPKRQRRWNSETIKVPEVQTSNLTTTTPKDSFQSTPRRSFNRSDSSLSGDAPKERVVPPSQKAATTSLRIDRFLRPFTLKAVQELLAKTGSVSDFWMDHIKTHCYVTYSSVEEATATRNALYNLQWPPNGGRLLVAEFVEPQEVKMRLESPLPSPAPITTPSPTTPSVPPSSHQPQAPPPSRHQIPRQQLPPPPPLPPQQLPPPPPVLSNPPPVRERLPPPPPLPKKPDPPIVTLDDLFKKTRATPRIYYLPLSDEQVAAKLAAQGKRAMEQ